MTTQEKLIELKESTKRCGFQCHLETYTEAIEALKKQIPLPIKHQDTYDDGCVSTKEEAAKAWNRRAENA